MFLELVNDPSAVSEFPVTPGLATTKFTSHFIKNYNSFPGYEVKIFYRGVPIGANEKEVSLPYIIPQQNRSEVLEGYNIYRILLEDS